jgi:hypothetical protein
LIKGTHKFQIHGSLSHYQYWSFLYVSSSASCFLQSTPLFSHFSAQTLQVF